MNKLKNLKHLKEIIEVTLSFILFLTLIISGNLVEDFSFFSVVYAMLSFLIILELFRMVSEYILNHKIQIRLIIDTFIIFTLREVILTFADKNIDYLKQGFTVFIGLTIVSILFHFRKKAIKESPSNCDGCHVKANCPIK
jgi:uncharacterized membrane protein (DUF373 family)